MSAVSTDSYKVQAQGLSLSDQITGEFSNSQASFSGASYQANERISDSFLLTAVGKAQRQIWASIANDKKGFMGGKYFKTTANAALRASKPFENVQQVADFLIKIDQQYRKTSLRGDGLFIGTNLSAVVLDVSTKAVYKIVRGVDASITIDQTPSASFVGADSPLRPTERTTVKFPDYHLVIETCSLTTHQGSIMLASPGVWEQLSQQRAAAKLHHIGNPAAGLGQGNLAAQMVAVALQQVVRTMMRSSDRRFSSLKSLEALQMLSPGQMSHNKYNVYQRLRGDVHGDMAVVVLSFQVDGEESQRLCKQVLAATNKTNGRRVSKWLKAVPSFGSLNSAASLNFDVDAESVSTPRSVSTMASARWALLRAHVLSEIEIKRQLRHAWVDVLYGVIKQADLNQGAGLVSKYVGYRYEQLHGSQSKSRTLAVF